MYPVELAQMIVYATVITPSGAARARGGHQANCSLPCGGTSQARCARVAAERCYRAGLLWRNGQREYVGHRNFRCCCSLRQVVEIHREYVRCMAQHSPLVSLLVPASLRPAQAASESQDL